MRRAIFAATIAMAPYPAFARPATPASMGQAWLACESIADATSYSHSKSDSEAAARREEERLTVPRADGHPACQLLVTGTKLDVVGAQADMRCVDEFHSYGRGCLWLPASVLLEPSSKRGW